MRTPELHILDNELLATVERRYGDIIMSSERRTKIALSVSRAALVGIIRW